MIKRKCSRPVGNDKLHFGSNRSFRPWKAKQSTRESIERPWDLVTSECDVQTIKSAYGRYLDIETGVISGRTRLWVMFWTRGVPLAKILATSRASRTPRKQNRKTEQMKQLSAFPSWKRQTFFYRLRTKKNKSNKKSSKHLEIDNNNNNNKRPAVT